LSYSGVRPERVAFGPEPKRITKVGTVPQSLPSFEQAN
jgi:hypothetical protein